MFKWLKNRFKRFIIDTVAEDIERGGKILDTIVKDIEQNGKVKQCLDNVRFARERTKWLYQGK